MPKEFIQKLTSFVEANLANEKFGPEELAHEAGMSHSNLNRKLNTITNQSASQFIREVRLKKAKELLQNEEATVAEIAYRVGFGSATYFSKCFHEFYGYSPGEMRNHVNEFKPENGQEKPKVENSSPNYGKIKILTGLIIILTVIFPLLIFLTKRFSISKEKSIAVLPFINDSHDTTNVFFVNGITEAITDKLSRIKDLKVTSRNSSERYRNNKSKSTPRIARELHVRYILEGSGQKIGDTVLVTIQLIDALSDKHILSHQYTEKFTNVFQLNSQIALDVASKIKALITSEEKQSIVESLVTNTEVKKLLIEGNEMLDIINLKNNPSEERIKQAIMIFSKAIQIDPVNSEAWMKLGNIYLAKNSLDSALFFAEKALQFDYKNPEIHQLLGIIYCMRHDEYLMEKSLKQSIGYDPENPWTYHWLGALDYYRGEFFSAISILLKTGKMIGSMNTDNTIQYKRLETNTLRLFRSLFALGFYDEGKYFADKWLEISYPGYKWLEFSNPDFDKTDLLKPDSLGYIYNLLWAGIINRRFEQSLQYGIQNRDKSKTVPNYYTYMGIDLLFMNRYDEAAIFFNEGIEINKKRKREEQEVTHLYGFALLKTGNLQQAEKYFKTSIYYYDTLLTAHPERKTPDHYYGITDRFWYFPNFVLTCIWSAKGDKQKALENMRLLRKNYRANDLQVVTFLKYFPMLDNIRSEPEFKAYLNEVETHYRGEYKKVEKLLMEESIIK